MHFLRPRRQRTVERISGDFGESKIGRHQHRANIYGTGWARRRRSGSCAKTGYPRSSWTMPYVKGVRRVPRFYTSAFHLDRLIDFRLMNENEIIGIWLQSHNDPYMRMKITDYCKSIPGLGHITPEYLERMYRLRVFI
jgi:hypothetical protein